MASESGEAALQVDRGFLTSLSTDLSFLAHCDKFVAGIAAGLATAVTCSPLDVLKARLQIVGRRHHQEGSHFAASLRRWKTARDLFSCFMETAQHEGLRGFYRGFSATVVCVPFFWSIYFPLYESIKAKVQARNGGASKNDSHLYSSLVNALAAVSAGACADICSNPLFVVRTRLMVMRHDKHAKGSGAGIRATAPSYEYRGLFHAVKSIYQKEGVMAFYSGLGASLLGLSHVAIYFPLYEELKASLRRWRRSRSPTPSEGVPHNSMDIAAASILAKITATSLTYPHEVLRTRLQAPSPAHDHAPSPFHPPPSFPSSRVPRSAHSPRVLVDVAVPPFPPIHQPSDSEAHRHRYKGVIDALRKIARHEGMAGLYRGCLLNIVRQLPATVVTMCTYERIRTLWHASFCGKQCADRGTL
ncbi:unnamed protein product [Vitrella brassicaformis CCMP3155]|uniref:Mitochondrial carrier protein n=2 Tax=Vitrella brassicaformis TaxID=1169539 RepID=A0A0G4E957_VITBC|nr:unnamed protein product [Vitrella brassicaformis CCMP3155]|eukprot:CEL92456.1 unnamed protein product [Vitrella brassicaformis CCMP3155]